MCKWINNWRKNITSEVVRRFLLKSENGIYLPPILFSFRNVLTTFDHVGSCKEILFKIWKMEFIYHLFYSQRKNKECLDDTCASRHTSWLGFYKYFFELRRILKYKHELDDNMRGASTETFLGQLCPRNLSKISNKLDNKKRILILQA